MHAPPPPQEKSGPPILKIACFGCIALVLLSVVCCGGITFMTFSMIKGSQPYKDGVAKAAADARVKKALGEPVQGEWWVGGNFQDQGATGTAQLMIPVSGPQGKGIVELHSSKSGGTWTTGRAKITLLNTGEVIDLMSDEEASDGGEGDKTEPADEGDKTEDAGGDDAGGDDAGGDDDK